MRSLVVGAWAALALSLLPAAAFAAPLPPVAAGLAAEARANSSVERVVFQCVWVRGVRRCRWVQGVPRPEAYPTGSPEWWRAMQDWGRTGGGRR